MDFSFEQLKHFMDIIYNTYYVLHIIFHSLRKYNNVSVCTV